MSQLFSPQLRRLNLLAMVSAQRHFPVAYHLDHDAQRAGSMEGADKAASPQEPARTAAA